MKKNNVLVVAAHPDDEVLGCGGTIAKHSTDGDNVTVLLLGRGLTSRKNKSAEKDFEKLMKSAQNANKILGVQRLEILDFPDNRLDGVDLLDLVQEIERIGALVKPDVVYTHFPNDVNVDHQAAFEAVITAFRPIPNSKVKKIFCFEVSSSTEWRPQTGKLGFSPNHFVDIRKTFAKKLKALGAYSSEMRQWPHARSLRAVKALSEWRGATVGVQNAEAFQLVRSIDF